MKSVSEMIRFLNRCFSTDTRSRRYGVRSANRVSGPEVMEARLLLAADLGEALFDPLVLGYIGEGQGLDSYFVAFDEPQSHAALQQITGASSVSTSQFVANGYTLEFDQDVSVQNAADAFSVLPDFKYLHPNIALQAETLAIPNDPLFPNQWHLQNTGQGNGTVGVDANIESVWDNYTGNGVTIAIIDDGLQTAHEDFVGNVRTDIDFDWNGNDADPNPDVTPNTGNFHGTAVAGVAAGKGNNGVGVTGAAWDAELVGLRLIAGPLTDQDTAEAFTSSMNIIDIYNNSWRHLPTNGIPGLTPSGPQALAALELAATTGRNGLGNISVFASGNTGNVGDNVNYLRSQNSRFTIAVGSLANTGVRASYSSPGASLVVVAPSNGGTLGITTTDLTGATGYDPTNYTNTFGGTSSAAPLVSGIIALMLEANPNLTYRDVTDILVHTSERVDQTNADWVQNGAGLWVNHEYGFGGVDAAAAVTAAVTHPRLGPELTDSTGVQVVNQAIPDSGNGSISQTVTVQDTDAVALEYVEVVFNATHGFIGDLQVVLTSPSGTQSVLADVRTDNGTSYSNWVFSSTRHWDESSAGDWTLTVTDLTANNVGTLDSYQLNFYGTAIDIPPPAAPQIVAPLGPTTDTTPTIQWTNVPYAATHNLEVTDSTGTVILSKQGLTGTVFIAPTLVQGDYQVKVQAVNIENEAGAFSQPAAFTVDVPEPLQPVIISPTGTIQNLSPLAQWSLVSGTTAVSYNLQVATLSGNIVVQETGIVQTSFQLPPLLQATYLIQVQGVNEVGETSAFSVPVFFLIDFPDPPKPVIISPSVDTTADAQPEFRWTTVNATTSTLWVGKVRAGTGTPQVPAVYDRIIYVTEHFSGSYTWFSQLPGEGTYAAWVRTFNSIGERSPWSDPEIFVLDVPIPQPPVLASIGITEDLTPTITWDEQTFGHSYQLWVNNLSTGQARAIHELDLVGVNSFTTANNLTQGRYRAWVQATNAVGEKGAWSPPLTFDVDLLPAGRPTVTGPFTLDAGSIPLTLASTAKPVFTWTAVNNGDTYELWVNHLDSGTTRIVHERGLTTNSFTPTENLPQGTYRAWVRAFNYAGEVGEWSSLYTFFLDVPTPGKPTIVEPLRNGVGSVENPSPTIVWTTLDPAESYHLQFEVVNTGELLIDTTGILEQRFAISQLLPETRYRTRVRGENSVGELGEWSDWYDVTIDVPNATTPVAYGPVGTVTEKDNRVTFEWQHSPGSVSYQILVRDLLRQESIAIQVTVSELDIVNSVAVSTHTLQDGTYRFWVRAFNLEGTASGWSNSQAFTVDANFASLDTREQDQGLEIALTSLQLTSQPQNEELKTAERPENLWSDAREVVQPVTEGDEQSQSVVPTSEIPAELHEVVETVMAEFGDPSTATVFGDGNSKS